MKSFTDAFAELGRLVGVGKAQQFVQAQLAKMTAARDHAMHTDKRRIGFSSKSPASSRRSSVLTPRTHWSASGAGSYSELDARIVALIKEGHPCPSRTAWKELRA